MTAKTRREWIPLVRLAGLYASAAIVDLVHEYNEHKRVLGKTAQQDVFEQSVFAEVTKEFVAAFVTGFASRERVFDVKRDGGEVFVLVDIECVDDDG